MTYLSIFHPIWFFKLQTFKSPVLSATNELPCFGKRLLISIWMLPFLDNDDNLYENHILMRVSTLPTASNSICDIHPFYSRLITLFEPLLSSSWCLLVCGPKLTSGPSVLALVGCPKFLFLSLSFEFGPLLSFSAWFESKWGTFIRPGRPSNLSFPSSEDSSLSFELSVTLTVSVSSEVSSVAVAVSLSVLGVVEAFFVTFSEVVSSWLLVDSVVEEGTPKRGLLDGWTDVAPPSLKL